MSRPKDTPLERLKHHVTGAIERGEATAIEAVVSAKHTPGPWKIEQHADKRFPDCMDLEIWNHNTHITTIHEHVDDIQIDLANARLIASAPDLLEAAQCAERLLNDLAQQFTRGSLEGLTVRDVYLELARAIAKARGES